MRRTVLAYDFERSLAYWICRASHAFERSLNEELSRHGITLRQWQVLGTLAHDGEMTQHDLAVRLGIEAPTLVGVLQRMERAGWIARTPCPGDARKKIVRPLPKVRPTWKRIVAAARRVRARAVRGVPPRSLPALRNLLQSIERNLTR